VLEKLTNVSLEEVILMRQKTEQAVFGGGCFWGVQEIIRNIPGVILSRVGYAGGHTKDPKYKDLSKGTTGHAEVVKVVYDPAEISFERLLDIFFRLHDPTTLNRQGNDNGTQYRSLIIAQDEEQEDDAKRVIENLEKNGKWSGKIVTEVVKAMPFYDAEEEHQDYLQKFPNGYTCHYLRD
jgi:methionine-S-sulfoxide reductase